MTYLGQNFLINYKYINFLINHIQKIYISGNYDVIWEIGPGKGVLTKQLSTITSNLYLFEKDQKFQEILEKIIINKSQIIWGDILDLDIDLFLKNHNLNPQKILVIGNLPYYITSPIIKKFFSETNIFSQGIMMVQQEVGDKIKTDASKKSYLRRLLNFQTDVKYLKKIPAQAFEPIPQVDSCLIEITRNIHKNINLDYCKFINFLNNVAPFKRKTLGKIFKLLKKKGLNYSENIIISKEILAKRLEELDWEEVRLISYILILQECLDK